MQHLFRNGPLSETLGRQQQSYDRAEVAHAWHLAGLLRATTTAPFEHLLRMIIGDRLVSCDVFDPALGLETDAPFDVVTSNFVAESVPRCPEEWKVGMRHQLDRVKSGGFFLQAALLGAEWYAVGEARLPATPIDTQMIRDMLDGHGFEVLRQAVFTRNSHERVGYRGMAFTFAKRRSVG